MKRRLLKVDSELSEDTSQRYLQLFFLPRWVVDVLRAGVTVVQRLAECRGPDDQLDFNTKTSAALQQGKQGTGQGQMCARREVIRMDRRRRLAWRPGGGYGRRALCLCLAGCLCLVHEIGPEPPVRPPTPRELVF